MPLVINSLGARYAHTHTHTHTHTQTRIATICTGSIIRIQVRACLHRRLHGLTNLTNTQVIKLRSKFINL